MFQLDLFPDGLESGAAKEVARYRGAIKLGLTQLLDTGGLIRNASLNARHRTDERQDGGGGLRPSQDCNEIITAMSSLEAFIINLRASIPLPMETDESGAS